ncbi:hypothetical protein ACLTEW_25015 [Gordonia lacunae]|uniref:hypothetical protein n=1 Tax=Gordonia lacunae TaxID=417102 RepID=UPI0039E33713
MVANPQTCDLKVMTSADLCQPETRGSESLIKGSELDYPVSYHSGYRDLDDQVTHNKRTFLVYIGAGLFLVASSIGLGVHQLTILWERRGGKKGHDNSYYH